MLEMQRDVTNQWYLNENGLYCFRVTLVEKARYVFGVLMFHYVVKYTKTLIQTARNQKFFKLIL